MTPREVFQKLSAGIGSGDWSSLHLLYADDAEVEMPFLPARLQGREQVREHFAQHAGGIVLEPRDVRIYNTDDPEVVVAEWKYDIRGRLVANIQVLRVRDGLIVETRDYHDHRQIAEILRG
ncbi:nuclear transport factor 2 family protein [Actinoplanes sp. NPDC026619]|uniref:nuclear transport factor 2 family protein n=1 Tax=Actinoplanes sp. NPDC026619 TaxID=3155798 RepID=UPI0033F6D7BF